MSEDPLEILYQDDWLVAVHKPAGYLVHPANEPQPDDQVTMKILRDFLGCRVHPIHRLDRPTCGVLLFGIEKNVATRLHQAFERHETNKVYHAVVFGIPKDQSWSCEEPIQKAPDKPLRSALTEFSVLQSINVNGCDLSLVEARPKTGRFHQIRRHLLHAGHPIVGDYRYVDIDVCDRYSELFDLGTRMLLQAKSLSFMHPLTQELVEIESNDDPLISGIFSNVGIR